MSDLMAEQEDIRHENARRLEDLRQTYEQQLVGLQQTIERLLREGADKDSAIRTLQSELNLLQCKQEEDESLSKKGRELNEGSHQLMTDISRLQNERDAARQSSEKLQHLLMTAVQLQRATDDSISRRLASVDTAHHGLTHRGSTVGSGLTARRSSSPLDRGVQSQPSSPKRLAASNSGPLDMHEKSFESIASDEGLDLSQRANESFSINLDMDGDGEEVVADCGRRLHSSVDRLLEVLEQSRRQLLEARGARDELLDELLLRADEVERVRLAAAEETRSEREDLANQLAQEAAINQRITLDLHNTEGLLDGYAAEREKYEEAAREHERRRESLASQCETMRARLLLLEEQRADVDAARRLAERQHEAMTLGDGSGGDAAAALLRQNTQLDKEKHEMSRQYEKDRRRLLERVRELEQKWEEGSHANDELLDQSQAEKHDLALQLDALERQLRASKQFIEEQTQEREAEREEYQRDMKKYQAALEEKKRMESALNKLQSQVTDLESQLQEDDEDQTYSRRSRQGSACGDFSENTYTLQMDEMKKVIRYLEVELDSKSAVERELKERFDSMEAELVALTGLNNDLEMEVRQRRLKDASLASTASAVLEELQEQQAAVTQQLAVMRQERDSLLVELERQRLADEELTHENNALQKQVNELLVQESALKSKLDSLKPGQYYAAEGGSGGKGHLSTSGRVLHEQLISSQEALEKKSGEITLLSDQLEHAHKLLAAKSSELEELSAQIVADREQSDAKRVIEDLEQQLFTVKEDKQHLIAELTSLRLAPASMPDYAQKLLNEKNEELDYLNSHISQLSNVVKMAQSKLSNAQGVDEKPNHNVLENGDSIIVKLQELLVEKDSAIEEATLRMQSQLNEIQSLTEFQGKLQADFDSVKDMVEMKTAEAEHLSVLLAGAHRLQGEFEKEATDLHILIRQQDNAIRDKEEDLFTATEELLAAQQQLTSAVEESAKEREESAKEREEAAAHQRHLVEAVDGQRSQLEAAAQSLKDLKAHYTEELAWVRQEAASKLEKSTAHHKDELARLSQEAVNQLQLARAHHAEELARLSQEADQRLNQLLGLQANTSREAVEAAILQWKILLKEKEQLVEKKEEVSTSAKLRLAAVEEEMAQLKLHLQHERQRSAEREDIVRSLSKDKGKLAQLKAALEEELEWRKLELAEKEKLTCLLQQQPLSSAAVIPSGTTVGAGGDATTDALSHAPHLKEKESSQELLAARQQLAEAARLLEEAEEQHRKGKSEAMHQISCLTSELEKAKCELTRQSLLQAGNTRDEAQVRLELQQEHTETLNTALSHQEEEWKRKLENIQLDCREQILQLQEKHRAQLSATAEEIKRQLKKAYRRHISEALRGQLVAERKQEQAEVALRANEREQQLRQSNEDRAGEEEQEVRHYSSSPWLRNARVHSSVAGSVNSVSLGSVVGNDDGKSSAEGIVQELLSRGHQEGAVVKGDGKSSSEGAVQELLRRALREGMEILALSQTTTSASALSQTSPSLSSAGRMAVMEDLLTLPAQRLGTWTDKKQALLVAQQALKDVLAQADGAAAKMEAASPIDGLAADWRADLLHAIAELFAKEREALVAELDSRSSAAASSPSSWEASSPGGAQGLERLEERVQSLASRQAAAVDALLAADRQSLLGEIRELRAHIDLGRAEHDSAQRQLSEEIEANRRNASTKERQLQRQSQLAEYRVTQEKVVADDLRAGLEAERQHIIILTEQLTAERSKSTNLAVDIEALSVEVAQLEEAAERRNQQLIALRQSNEEERVMHAQRLAELRQREQDSRDQLQKWADTGHKMALLAQGTVTEQLTRDLELEKEKRIEANGLVEKERRSMVSMRLELVNGRVDWERKESAYKSLVADLQQSLSTEMVKCTNLASRIDADNRELEELRGKLNSESERVHEALASDAAAWHVQVDQLRSLVSLERGRCLDLQRSVEREASKVLSLSAARDSDRACSLNEMEKERAVNRQLKKALDLAEARSQEASHTMVLSRRKVEEQRLELDGLHLDGKVLEQDLASERQQRQQLLDQISRLQLTRESDRRQLSEFEQLNEKLRQELAVLHHQVATLSLHPQSNHAVSPLTSFAQRDPGDGTRSRTRHHSQQRGLMLVDLNSSMQEQHAMDHGTHAEDKWVTSFLSSRGHHWQPEGMATLSYKQQLEALRQRLQLVTAQLQELATALDSNDNRATEKELEDVVAALIQLQNSSGTALSDWSSREREPLVQPSSADGILQHNAQLKGFVAKLSEEKAELRAALCQLEEEICLYRERSVAEGENAFSAMHATSAAPHNDSYTKVDGGPREHANNIKLASETLRRAELRAQLAEQELGQAHARLADTTAASTRAAAAARATEERLRERLQTAHSKFLKAESFRKALMFQKRYLLLLLGGFQECETATLSAISKMSSRPHELLPSAASRSASPGHALGKARGCVRFRSVVRAVAAIRRMQILVRKWRTSVQLLPPHSNMAASTESKGRRHELSGSELSPQGHGHKLIGGELPPTKGCKHELSGSELSPSKGRRHELRGSELSPPVSASAVGGLPGHYHRYSASPASPSATGRGLLQGDSCTSSHAVNNYGTNVGGLNSRISLPASDSRKHGGASPQLLTAACGSKTIRTLPSRHTAGVGINSPAAEPSCNGSQDYTSKLVTAKECPTTLVTHPTSPDRAERNGYAGDRQQPRFAGSSARSGRNSPHAVTRVSNPKDMQDGGPPCSTSSNGVDSLKEEHVSSPSRLSANSSFDSRYIRQLERLQHRLVAGMSSPGSAAS